MSTPKRLYADERIIYHPALLTCLHWGDLLVAWNSLAWEKTVQTLAGLLSVATRPGRCPHAMCPGSRMRLRSAVAQRLAPPGSPEGYEVLVRIGRLRQHQRTTSKAIHTDLSCRFSLSETHVRARSQHVYVPLLACHERQQRGRLAQVAQEQGGLIVALDGLAPQGGEPHIWCMRDVSTGLTRRRGWLAPLDQPPLEAFLAPLRDLAWPMLAVRSDKQTGWVPAVATAVPNSRHQCCQAPSLRHLAAPLAAADAAFTGELRHTVRQQGGDVIRQAPQRPPGHAGVLTVPGVVPRPVEEATVPAGQRPAPAAAPTAPAPDAAQVITQRVRHTRSLLTLQGQPPLCLAGLETYERLSHGAGLRLAGLAQRYTPRLAPLSQGLQAVVSPVAEPSQLWHQGAAWLQDIADLFAPVATPPSRAEDVARQRRRSLDTGQRQPAVPPTFATFGRHLDTGSRSSWPGLFHCYAVPGLPRTNNEWAGHVRETRRRLLQTTGQQGQTQRMLQRQGAWALLSSPLTEATFQEAWSQISSQDLAQERQRFAVQRQRFRLQRRSVRQTQAPFEPLRQQWSGLPPTGTGWLLRYCLRWHGFGRGCHQRRARRGRSPHAHACLLLPHRLAFLMERFIP